jgi:aldehyde:ferredoxin oxidoreductase
VAEDETAVEGPEYGTIVALGWCCGISSLDSLIRLNRLCDDLGLDTVATGSVLALAMESTGSGLRDFGIRFGEDERALECARQIAHREGAFGDLTFGPEELPVWTRAGRMVQLLHAAVEQGHGHLHTPSGSEDLALLAMRRGLANVADSLPVCAFWPASADTLARLFALVTGWPISPEELLEAGERIATLGESLGDAGRDDTTMRGGEAQ